MDPDRTAGQRIGRWSAMRVTPLLVALVATGFPGPEAHCQKVFFDAPVPDSLIGLAVWNRTPNLDFIISTDVFEHIPLGNQHHAASEVFRVLKAKAKGYIEVPNKFQMLDEHNKVWFGTYLPPMIRRLYTTAFTKNAKYLQCWERTGHAWHRLFETAGLTTKVVPYAYRKKWLPPNRFKIFLEKPANSNDI